MVIVRVTYLVTKNRQGTYDTQHFECVSAIPIKTYHNRMETCKRRSKLTYAA